MKTRRETYVAAVAPPILELPERVTIWKPVRRRGRRKAARALGPREKGEARR